MQQRPQTEWGVRVTLDFFLGGAGAGLLGTYLIVGGLDGLNKLSLKIIGAGGFLILAGLLLLASELGHPSRSTRSFANFKTSWMARGAILNVVLLGLVAVLMMAASLGIRTITPEIAFCTVICSALVASYPGFLLFSAKDIRRWRSPLLPALMFCYSVMSGLCLLSLADNVYGLGMSMILQPILPIGVALVACLLWAFEKGDRGSKGAEYWQSPKAAGRPIPVLVVGLGLVLPFLCYLYLMLFGMGFGTALIPLGAISFLIGSFFFRHSLLRSASHEPMTLLRQART
jgi:formate-dependent nitrite reductase membrane component NrfD